MKAGSKHYCDACLRELDLSSVRLVQADFSELAQTCADCLFTLLQQCFRTLKSYEAMREFMGPEYDAEYVVKLVRDAR